MKIPLVSVSEVWNSSKHILPADAFWNETYS